MSEVMQIRYEIVPEHRMIVEQIEGTLTIEDLFRKTERLFADPDFDVSYCGVIDMRKADAEITRVELYAFADFLNQNPAFQGSRWAAVVNSPMLTALSELVKQRVVEQASVGVFSSVESAARYLEKPQILDYLEPD